MTQTGPAREAAAIGEAPSKVVPGFLEWGPIFAGAVLASALSFVLLTFGTAIGLSATSPWPNSGLPARVVASLAIFWSMAQQIATFMAGGYVAGRLRSRWHEAPQDEVEFRDGLHGGLVWAVGIVIGAALLMATAGAIARTGAELTGKTAVAAASAVDPMDLVLDTMLRPAAGAPKAPGAPQDPRPQVSRLLTSAASSGSLPERDRTYLAQLVAQHAGISQEEAAKRVDEAINGARQAADKARRATILTGLVTAIALMVSFAAAWWAAMKGGEHRDNAVPARLAFHRGLRARASHPK
jgi:hypothetical protein